MTRVFVKGVYVYEENSRPFHYTWGENGEALTDLSRATKEEGVLAARDFWTHTLVGGKKWGRGNRKAGTPG